MLWRVKLWALLKFHYMQETLKTNKSTQVANLFGKILLVRQSAGNQILSSDNRVGSSETIRETLNHNICYPLKLNSKFKWWLIGFTEGDGSFVINKTGYLEFKITQSSSDAQVLFYIKKTLGFGSVSVQDKTQKTHHFRVRDKKGLLTLIKLFNGNLLTTYRNNQFKVWVKAFNKRYDTNLHCTDAIEKFTLKNAWLSGFTDAEGCFNVTLIKRSENYTQVQVRYILFQKNEKILFTSIADKLDGKISYFKSYEGYNMTVNLSKLKRVISYFKLYPLKTKKKVKYLNWIKIYKLVIKKEHLNDDGFIKIQGLINKLKK